MKEISENDLRNAVELTNILEAQLRAMRVLLKAALATAPLDSRKNVLETFRLARALECNGMRECGFTSSFPATKMAARVADFDEECEKLEQWFREDVTRDPPDSRA